PLPARRHRGAVRAAAETDLRGAARPAGRSRRPAGQGALHGSSHERSLHRLPRRAHRGSCPSTTPAARGQPVPAVTAGEAGCTSGVLRSRMMPSRSFSVTDDTAWPLFTAGSWLPLSLMNVAPRLTVRGPLPFGFTSTIPLVKSRRHTPLFHALVRGETTAEPSLALNSSNH